MIRGAEKPPVDSPSSVKRVLGRAAEAEATVRGLHESEERLHQAVVAAYQGFQAAATPGRLQAIPIERLKDVSGARLPVARLEEAGFRTLLDLADATPAQLRELPGIGAKSADPIVAAVERISRAAEQNTQVTADLDLRAPDAAALLASLYRVHSADRLLARVREPAQRLGGALASLTSAAKPLSSRVRRVFTRGARRDEARQAVASLEELLDNPKTTRDLERI